MRFQELRPTWNMGHTHTKNKRSEGREELPTSKISVGASTVVTRVSRSMAFGFSLGPTHDQLQWYRTGSTGYEYESTMEHAPLRNPTR